jgi:molecular chaperone DnaK (HSP70)
MFLAAMRERAAAHFRADVRRVVLGRPARFSEDDAADALAERRLEEAARLAGFDEVFFCEEPVAAAYDFAEALDQPRFVLVADLGGGTSDFTVVRLGCYNGSINTKFQISSNFFCLSNNEVITSINRQCFFIPLGNMNYNRIFTICSNTAYCPK